MKDKKKIKKNTGILPIYIFEFLFVLAPIIYALFLSFMTRTDSLNVEYVFTLKNYLDIFNPVYLPSLVTSFKLAIVTTAICIVLGYPAGLCLANINGKIKNFFLLAHMLPFFINSMVRICGLIIIFRSNGLLDQILMNAGITNEPLHLLYSFPSVVIGMVYVLLPMMIYSVYSVADKVDSSSLEASRILGANKVQTFFKITLPLTTSGLLNGITLCFIPSMGLYIISTLLGGGKTVLISNVIEDQLMKVHNLPFAASLSVFLMILTGLIIYLFRFLDPVRRVNRR